MEEAMSAATAARRRAILPDRGGLFGAALRHRSGDGRSCCLFLLLAPAVLWLGIVYLGSLFALLLQSFFRLDEFSGMIVREFTLTTYAELLHARQNLDIIMRTVSMAALVTLASALIAFPIAYYARPATRAANGRRCSISAIMLPLWSSYLVKVYAWKLILAKEGILTWLFEQLHLSLGCSTRWLSPAGDRRQFAVGSASPAPSSSSSMSGCPS